MRATQRIRLPDRGSKQDEGAPNSNACLSRVGIRHGTQPRLPLQRCSYSSTREFRCLPTANSHPESKQDEMKKRETLDRVRHMARFVRACGERVGYHQHMAIASWPVAKARAQGANTPTTRMPERRDCSRLQYVALRRMTRLLREYEIWESTGPGSDAETRLVDQLIGDVTDCSLERGASKSCNICRAAATECQGPEPP
ncbi:hypothetical protein BDP55DRAFT_240002 [Colletotrichum godetiae]|uniref:Uncharacterized protein n=1 Tax=Colletotrichum godetiae TaxID=1209918 RepID=A0AAJ0AF93_9PEZI|nr:uncharacterized protein BDP55DRAFT_240002 [Colletotrichum godetiae]KAK1672822.1 hypothetical protein BDP55DRAFT_240002 [Colletotrichum godetiae]